MVMSEKHSAKRGLSLSTPKHTVHLTKFTNMEHSLKILIRLTKMSMQLPIIRVAYMEISKSNRLNFM